MKSAGPRIFFTGRSSPSNSVSLIALGLFRLSVGSYQLRQLMSSGEFIHFIQVVRFTGIKLLIVFPNITFNVCKIYSDNPFVLNVNTLCLFILGPSGKRFISFLNPLGDPAFG